MCSRDRSNTCIVRGFFSLYRWTCSLKCPVRSVETACVLFALRMKYLWISVICSMFLYSVVEILLQQQVYTSLIPARQDRERCHVVLSWARSFPSSSTTICFNCSFCVSALASLPVNETGKQNMTSKPPSQLQELGHSLQRKDILTRKAGTSVAGISCVD